jgi:tetratricopeptide (TPR) repeat protein
MKETIVIFTEKQIALVTAIWLTSQAAMAQPSQSNLQTSSPAGNQVSVSKSLKFDGVKWAKATKAGSNAFINSDFGLAERSFKEALEEVKLAPANDIRIAESFNNLGVLYVSRGLPAKAEPFFEKAAKVREAALGNSDKDVIAGQSKLAQFYLTVGKRDKALVLINKIADYGDYESKQLNEVSGAFKKLSLYYHNHRKLEDCEIAVKQAEEKTLSEIKAQAVETAVMLDAVGNAIKDNSKLAERLFKSALTLRERTLTSEHAALASSLENLGKLYMADGRSAQAEPLLRRAYEISLSTLGPDRQETQKRLDNLAQICTTLNKNGEAEGLYRKILDSQEKGAKKNSPELLANFASLLVKEGRASEALPYYARALKIQESLNGPQHASLATLLDSYAYALNKCNRQAEAQKCQARAKSIRG